MFRKISTRLSASFVAFFLLIAASVLASQVFLRDLPTDDLALHLSVRAQALVAKTSRDIVVYAKLQDPDTRLEQRDAVLANVRAFEITIKIRDDPSVQQEPPVAVECIDEFAGGRRFVGC